MAKATFPNYLIRKGIYALQAPFGSKHLHLGCGPKYLPGFVNIDANPRHRLDLWLDVRNGLPFPSNSVDSIYSTHMFEHFFAAELNSLLRECWRVLRPGKGIRLIVPNLASAIAAYNQQRGDWFSDSFPNRFGSLGGRFANFVFCDGQHRTAFDFGYMEEILRAAGFQSAEEVSERKSRVYGDQAPPFEPGDSQELAHSLYVEAFK